MSKKKGLPAGDGVMCVVAQTSLLCTTCASGLCQLCGENGRWVREQWPKKRLWQKNTVEVFWELRVKHGHPNVLRVRTCCKHCNEIEYEVLHSASRLTIAIMEGKVRSGMAANDAFWSVLVKDKETEFGTVWESCPKCGEAHSVHTMCEETK